MTLDPDTVVGWPDRIQVNSRIYASDLDWKWRDLIEKGLLADELADALRKIKATRIPSKVVDAGWLVRAIEETGAWEALAKYESMRGGA